MPRLHAPLVLLSMATALWLWRHPQPAVVGPGKRHVGDWFDRDTGAIYDRDFTDASLRALCQCDGRPPINADYDPATP